MHLGMHAWRKSGVRRHHGVHDIASGLELKHVWLACSCSRIERSMFAVRARKRYGWILRRSV